MGVDARDDVGRELAFEVVHQQLDALGAGEFAHGFRDVDHYWSEAASGPWLAKIRVPTLLLNARNDPFLPEHALLAAARDAAPCVLLEFPRSGGHVGFRHAWLAQRLLEFLDP